MSGTKRCGACNKRLPATDAIVGACRCGGVFCSAHREAAAHACAHDYRAQQSARLLREGLAHAVVADKMEHRV
jgi:predicted nucleic acid binding AN1-type Zn finger protein